MLVPCRRCGRHVSVRDEVCPFCRNGSTLAKVGAAALTAGVLLAGCDAGKTHVSAQGSANAPQRAYATVRGRVTDRLSKPIANARITINGNDAASNRSLSKTVPTDSDGRFLLDLLEPGTYIVYFTFDTGTRQGNDQRPITLKAGEDANVDVVLDLQERVSYPPYGAPPTRRRVV